MQNGLQVSACVQIDGDVRIEHTVYDDAVELHIGGWDGVELLASERGLTALIERGSQALTELQSLRERG